MALSTRWTNRPRAWTAPSLSCGLIQTHVGAVNFHRDNCGISEHGSCRDVALALGAAIGSSWQGSNHPALAQTSAEARIEIPGWMTAPLLVFTLIAYAVWFGPLALDPSSVFEVFSGERDNLRGVISTMPGVTTLTQCGIAFVVLVTIKRYSPGGATIWERIGIWLVILLAVIALVGLGVAWVLALRGLRERKPGLLPLAARSITASIFAVLLSALCYARATSDQCIEVKAGPSEQSVTRAL